MRDVPSFAFSDLATPDALLPVLIAAVLGGAGGSLHAITTSDPAAPTAWWRSALVGLVAGVGALWLSPPATVTALIAQSLLTGFFGQAVLSTLQARVTAGVANDRLQRAAAVANDAIDAASGPPATPHTVHMLRARLADVSAPVVTGRAA